MRGALAGAAVALAGDFDATDDVGAIASLVTALGARALPDLTPEATHLVRGGRTRRLATLLGKSAVERLAEAMQAAGHGLRVLDECDLERVVADATGVAPLARAVALARDGALAAPRDATPPPPAAPDAHPTAADALPLDALTLATAAAASRAPSDLRALAFLADRLADARLADLCLRDRVARAIEARGDGDAVAALARAITALRGARGPADCAALGRLAARGASRFGPRRAPLAVELRERRGSDLCPDLAALARRAGALECLADERGARVHRVRVARVPPPAVTPPGGVPLYELVAAARTRRGARLWVAGVPLPAALPWPSLLALLEPLAAPA